MSERQAHLIILVHIGGCPLGYKLAEGVSIVGDLARDLQEMEADGEPHSTI